MIVVVGQPLYRETDDGASVNGLPARIALHAATGGRSVQLVGKAGEDPEGDAIILALAEGGVGHVALLRDAGMPTPRATTRSGGSTGLDAADVDLALRYLTDYAVLVLADPADADLIKVVTGAAGWVGAHLVVVVAPGQPILESLPADAIVIEAPSSDPDGAFGTLVGSLAAALDDGVEPGEAFRASIEATGWAGSTED